MVAKSKLYSKKASQVTVESVCDRLQSRILLLSRINCNSGFTSAAKFSGSTKADKGFKVSCVLRHFKALYVPFNIHSSIKFSYNSVAHSISLSSTL